MKQWLKVVGIFLLFLLIAGGAFTALTHHRYGGHLRRAKEVVLQQNLWTMRRAIDFYWQDREKPPQSLQDLISSGYLREIPLDPVTQSSQTWIIEREKEKSARIRRLELLMFAAPPLVQIRTGSLIMSIEKYPLKEIGYGSFKQIQEHQLWRW